MKIDPKNKWRRWELALLLGVAVALVAGTWLSGSQAALADQLMRLHVVGASNSAEDQTVKLKVRDAVLAQAKPWLRGVTSREEAQAVLASHLEELALAGAEAAGGGVTVTVQLEESAWFPTKEYEDFSRPAGYYPALKVVIGEGEGRNWWCVVFPPLCTGAVREMAGTGGLSDVQVGLITGETEEYVIKFRLMEWWDQLVRRLS